MVEVERAENSMGTRRGGRGLVHRRVTAGKARDSAFLGGANEETEGFGPLKAALRVIHAVFADRESVRSQSSCGSRGKQDQYPPLTDNSDGRTFQLVPR